MGSALAFLDKNGALSMAERRSALISVHGGFVYSSLDSVFHYAYKRRPRVLEQEGERHGAHCWTRRSAHHGSRHSDAGVTRERRKHEKVLPLYRRAGCRNWTPWQLCCVGAVLFAA